MGKAWRKTTAEASKWFRKAAEQGHPKAQALGFMYDSGHGVPQDYAEAAKLCRKLADQGLDLANTSSASCTTAARASRRTTSRR